MDFSLDIRTLHHENQLAEFSENGRSITHMRETFLRKHAKIIQICQGSQNRYLIKR